MQRHTIINKMDSLSSVHLKINLALNFVMIALTVLLVLYFPYLSMKNTKDNNDSGYFHLLSYKDLGKSERIWYHELQKNTHDDCLQSYTSSKREVCYNAFQLFLAGLLTTVAFTLACVMNVLSVIFTWNSIRLKKRFYCASPMKYSWVPFIVAFCVWFFCGQFSVKVDDNY